MYVVYKHTTPSGKVYIGITKRKPKYRWNNGNGYKKNEHFYRAILKYGWENINHEIVGTGLTKRQACDLEIKLIAKYDSTNRDKGYNHSTGGECGAAGVHPSAETLRKRGEALKGKHLSAETRRKISEAKKGANHPYYGKHFSAEHRLKMSESMKRAYLNDPELRQKISESLKGANNPNYGKHLSAETRRKISEAEKGKPSPRKGKHLSAETRREISKKLKGRPLSAETRKKMSEARKGRKISERIIRAMTDATSKKVLCVETGEVYKSISEAGRQSGISFKSISNCLRGITKTSGGYHWKYAD